MNSRLFKLIHAGDSRYLTAEEQKEILSYTNTLPERFRIAAQVAEVEAAAVKRCIEETKKRYPNFERFHAQAWGKAYRDVQLTVRYNVQAMMLDDMKVLDEKLLFWLRTILASFNFTPQFNRDTYTYLRDAFKAGLPAAAYKAMEPYFNRNIEVLADIPEPATPQV